MPLDKYYYAWCVVGDGGICSRYGIKFSRHAARLIYFGR